eukprot:354258-Chlamydomonas_euryale.AAC.2
MSETKSRADVAAMESCHGKAAQTWRPWKAERLCMCMCCRRCLGSKGPCGRGGRGKLSGDACGCSSHGRLSGIKGCRE